MPINAKDIVKGNFLRNKWEADDARREEAQEKLDLYMDDYEEIIKKKIKELFHKKNYERLYYHVNQSQNILKRVVNEISTIYKAEATRQLKKENKQYEEIKKETNFDVKFKRINRYTNLLNECLLKIGVRENKIVYDIITPNICMVIQNEDDPTQADAIIYSTTRVNTVGDDVITYYYWSVEGDYLILDNELRIKKVVYDSTKKDAVISPYYDKKIGKFILPFVVFHRQEPDYAFWDQDTGRDLYNATILIGVKMTLFDYYFKVASIKQPYVIGDKMTVPSGQVLDPLTVFQAKGEGAQIGLLDMQINMEQLQKALIFQLNSVINNYGISADQYTLSISEMSGRALKIRNRALMEIREEQIPLYRQYEQEVFEKTRIVNNAHLTPKIPDNAELSVDFGEIDFPEDPEEELRLNTKMLKSGIISLGQFYQKYNPDIKDEKEAEKIIVGNLQKLQETKEKYPNLDDALDYILGTGWKRSGETGKEEEGEET